MSAKRALIVDDSKSARAFLARILEKYEVAVDSAENAEQALEYLGDHRPDVIFMDHLMPGMDGFQALQYIKNNPRTAMIPIMMYTSQEGELYLGQARALGAIGVLPKQIKPADVSRVLYQLRILPDRRGTEEQTSFRPVTVAAPAGGPAAGARPSREPPQLRVVSSDATSAPSSTDLRALVESVVEQHMGDLHRGVTASLDAQSERLLGDVRVAVQDAIAQASANNDAAFDTRNSRTVAPRWLWGGITAATVAALALAALWWNEAASRRELAAQLVAARQQVVSLADQRDAVRRELAGVVVTSPAPATADELGPRRIAVPYGETALAGQRLDDLRTLLTRLQSDGFKGTVTVTTYAGRYCLQKNGDGFEPAPDTLAVARCDLLGNPFDESLSAAQREPLSFANFVGSIRQQSAGTIRVQLNQGTTDNVAVAYPAVTEAARAGEWNRAAAANNRIEITLQP